LTAATVSGDIGATGVSYRKVHLMRSVIASTALAVVINLAAIASAPAGDSTWFFAPKEGMEPARFGFSSGLSAGSLPIFGECGKDVRVQIYFERAALAELVRPDADPSINFVMDNESQKVPVALFELNEADPQTWTPKLSDLPKELFEKLAGARKVSVQLLGGDKVLDTYDPPTDRGRKKAMQRVAKECF
jgi:hypothetical protein